MQSFFLAGSLQPIPGGSSQGFVLAIGNELQRPIQREKAAACKAQSCVEGAMLPKSPHGIPGNVIADRHFRVVE